MAATVTKLFEHMLTVHPPEELFDIKDGLPIDLEMKLKTKNFLEAGNTKEYVKAMISVIPSDGNRVFENIFIGGKRQVTVLFLITLVSFDFNLQWPFFIPEFRLAEKTWHYRSHQLCSRRLEWRNFCLELFH